jgi:hypothetical protein
MSVATALPERGTLPKRGPHTTVYIAIIESSIRSRYLVGSGPLVLTGPHCSMKIVDNQQLASDRAGKAWARAGNLELCPGC